MIIIMNTFSRIIKLYKKNKILIMVINNNFYLILKL